MHIAPDILSVPSGTAAWRWQYAYLLVVANGFRRDARGAGELADGQWSLHSLASFFGLHQQRYTFQALEGQGENMACGKFLQAIQG